MHRVDSDESASSTQASFAMDSDDAWIILGQLEEILNQVNRWCGPINEEHVCEVDAMPGESLGVRGLPLPHIEAC